MEEYINDDTLIKNDVYNAIKNIAVCPSCHKILIEPLMCLKCQTVYCQKCVKSWEKNEDKCPNKCIEPNYQPSKGKIVLLSSLQFKCKDCKMTIKYNEFKKHKEECCADLIQTYEIIDFSNTNISLETPSSNANSSKRLKKLTNEEMSILKNEGKDIYYFNSKKY